MMGTVATLDFNSSAAETVPTPSRAVLVVEDGRRLSRVVGYMCDYLGLTLHRVGTDADLAPLLRRHAPLAVVCTLDGRGQDGCHVMKLVAVHDRALPVMLVAGSNPAMIGAAEAVEEACGLSGVRTLQDDPGLGDVVEFLLASDRFAPASVPEVLAA